MIRRPPRTTLDRSSAASDVYKRQEHGVAAFRSADEFPPETKAVVIAAPTPAHHALALSLIHISEPTRPY